jgi:hypothetical protein
MLNFDEWYEVNPIKDKIEALGLSEKDKKRLTPVYLTTATILALKPLYEEMTLRYKSQFIPEFAVKQFTLIFKGRTFIIVPFYELEKEFKYLCSKIPEGVGIASEIKPVDKLNTMFDTLIFRDLQLNTGYKERIRVLHNNKILTWKFKEIRN